MLNQLLDKIAGLPWYFWALALAWGSIEFAGWWRMHKNRSRRWVAAWAEDGDQWRQWRRVRRAPE